jgi:6-phosphogluconolactonase
VNISDRVKGQVNMAHIVKTFESAANAVKFTAEYWLESCRDSLSQKGWFTVALSGGRTPVHLFREVLKTAEDDLWNRTFIFQVDERFVPRDHEDNNFSLIERELTGKIEIPGENVYPMPVKGVLKSAAVKYEKSIKKFFSSRDAEVSFDLIIPGLGEDGHTASIFPGSPVMDEEKRLVREVESGAPLHRRITLTFPAINSSRRILLLAPGSNKAGPVKRVLEDDDSEIPAAHLMDGKGEVIFILDRDSASMLNG